MSHESDYKAGQKDGQDLIDRAQALADFHKAERTGNADLNMTGEPNNTPERLTSHLRPLLTNKGDPADHPGATPGDAFNRSLDISDDKFVPMGQGVKMCW